MQNNNNTFQTIEVMDSTLDRKKMMLQKLKMKNKIKIKVIGGSRNLSSNLTTIQHNSPVNNN